MSSVGRFLPTAKIDAARDLNNYKPYRTAAQQVEARRTARKVDGRWVSSAEVSFHPIKKEMLGKS